MLRLHTLIFLYVGGITCQESVPNFFHICRTSMPNYDDCFLRSVLSLKPYLRTGVEDVFPTLEPYDLGRIVLADEYNPIFGLSLYIKNLKVYGASNFGLKNLRIARGVGESVFDINLFQTYVEGDFRIFGKTLLSIPVDIVGRIYANLTNSRASCSMMSRMEMAGGKNYAQIYNLRMSTYTEAARVTLRARDNRQDLIVQMITAAINAQFQYFSQGTARRLEEQLEKTVQIATNMRLSSYSYDDLFPV